MVTGSPDGDDDDDDDSSVRCEMSILFFGLFCAYDVRDYYIDRPSLARYGQ